MWRWRFRLINCSVGKNPCVRTYCRIGGERNDRKIEFLVFAGRRLVAGDCHIRVIVNSNVVLFRNSRNQLFRDIVHFHCSRVCARHQVCVLNTVGLRGEFPRFHNPFIRIIIFNGIGSGIYICCFERSTTFRGICLKIKCL